MLTPTVHKAKPFDSEAMSLDDHVAIEASAGTGKTYSIGSIALRIIGEGRAEISSILIMTFTEKATAELTHSIRARLQSALDKHENDSAMLATCERWQQALIDFDQAQIHTIHSFCQQTLQRFALENRTVMDLEVCTDEEIYLAALRRVLHGLWPRIFGASLRGFLAGSGFSGTIETWGSGILQAAREFYEDESNPALSDRTEPLARSLAEYETAVSRFATMIVEARTYLNEFITTNSSPTEDAPDYAAAPETHPFGAIENNKLIHGIYWKPAQQFLRFMITLAYTEPGDPLMQFLTQRAWQKNQFYDRFLASGAAAICTDAKWNKDKAESPEGQALLAAIQPLEKILAPLLELHTLTRAWPALNVAAVRREAIAEKKRRGLISYNDMLTHLAASLRQPGGDALAGKLREQFRYALIDEFQDTDRTQWEILRRVFMPDEMPPSTSSAPSTQSRLLLIGDPKQAIYGFRGADVQTYVAAREALLAAGGKYYTLDTSYRSTPDLVAALNTIFVPSASPLAPDEDAKDNASGWFSPGEGIEYRTVKSAAGALPMRIAEGGDRTDRAAVSIIDVRAFDRATPAKQALAQYIAAEIGCLLGAYHHGESRLEIETRATDATGQEVWQRRPLRADDICILVQMSSEVAALEAALNAHSPPIPHSFYKKSGLYQSLEAQQIATLLEALSAPHDHSAFRRMLLTDFFRQSIWSIDAWDDAPANHPLRSLFRRWCELVVRGRWTQLFQSCLNDTGVLLDAFPRGESTCLAMARRSENYRHIFHELDYWCQQSKPDMHDLLAHLAALKNGSTTANDNLQRLETERPNVQILTMHTSKGLQFPVVFMAGGHSTGREPDLYRYHENISAMDDDAPTSARRVVFDIEKSAAGKQRSEAEAHHENWRLYYVALTRARFKLYIPQHHFVSRKPPFQKVFNPLIERLQNAPDDVAKSPHIDFLDVTDRAPQAISGAKGISREALFSAADALPAQINSDTVTRGLAAPSFGWLWSCARLTTSFSGLHQRRPAHSQYPITPDDDDAFVRLEERGAGEVDAPEVASTAAPAQADTRPGELPSGAFVGNIFHEFFEEADFSEIEKAADIATDQHPAGQLLAALMDTHELIERTPEQLEQYPAPGRYQAQLATMIWRTLNAWLPTIRGELFQLRHLTPAQRRHEMAFHYPLPVRGQGEIDEAFLSASGLTLAAGNDREGFLRGFIDLVFRGVDERYYILDWKSNRLPAYDAAGLAFGMSANGYHLQYAVYALAVRRWLAQCGLDPEQSFGGVYYIFMRGVRDDEDTATSGVYIPPASTLTHAATARELFLAVNSSEAHR